MADDRELETRDDAPISLEEIDGEMVTSLPNKEVMSLLDVSGNVDLGLDLAAPIDLAVAANLNVAAPIEAAASANVLSPDAQALAVTQQQGSIDQSITGSSTAVSEQDATLTQGADAGADTGAATQESVPTDAAAPESLTTPTVDGATGVVDDATGVVDGATGTDVGGVVGDGVVVPDPTDTVGDTTDGIASFLQGGSLLSADIDIDADANLTAPVSGAVAANANIAAPIDAAVAANVGSEGAIAQASAAQQVNITQSIDADANATADQSADVSQ